MNESINNTWKGKNMPTMETISLLLKNKVTLLPQQPNINLSQSNVLQIQQYQTISGFSIVFVY